jgi:catechol 2,3-dioxygenase-like lactoylglutathione lyase family enzyme
MSDAIRTVGIDHMVLNVSDIETSLAFYCSELGMAPVRVEEWRRGECTFPSARADESFIIDFGTGDRPVGVNLNHFCLVVEKMDFESVAKSGRVRVKSGPTTNYGARGIGCSIKILDPDDNTVELRYYA